MARLFARIAALVLGISAFAGADAQTYTYTFYVGNSNSPGCTISTPAGPVSNVGWRLQATVTAGVAPQFGSISRSNCSNGVFGSPSVVTSASAVGLNTGAAGADVIEVQLPKNAVGPTPSPKEVLAVVATSAGNSDALIASASAKGAITPTSSPPVLVPSLGAGAIALLGLALLAIGWFVLRRHNLLVLSLLLVAGTAWAVSIVIDGQVGDWAAVTPSSDPVGDVGEPGIDLIRLYVTDEGPYAYLRVDVANLQSPPVANPADANLLEDGNTTITLTGSDPGGSPLTFQIASMPTLGSLGPIVPINATSASVQYTATVDEFGSDSFTFTANNGTQTSAPATFAITIAPVNDAPSFSAANPPPANEGSGAQIVPGWASFDPGPGNESGQVALEYLVSAIGNPALFAVAPAVAADGTLSYTLAADANGSSGFTVAVRDDGGTADGGVDLSATQNFTISVNAVNAAPSFVGGGDVSALEDAGAQTVAGWATAINDGDPDQVQTLTFNVTSNTNPALFSAGPTVDPVSGNLTYTTAADANGSAQVTLTLSDDGGTANGGSDTSAPYTLNVQVGEVNDAPSFVAVDPPAVNEGSGAQSVPNWAAFDPGPTNESGQVALEYLVSAIGNPALFTVAPSVAATGALTYTIAPNVSGSSSFSVAVRDDGGTANGGLDLSASQTFTITVNSVNSEPSFVGGGDVASPEDAGAQNFAAWATAIDDGDPEVQTLTFNVTGNTNPALFAAGPEVNAVSGDLSYTTAADASGSATITLTLSDDGGTASGGSDTSAPYSFTITVSGTNDAPTVTAKSHTTHSAIELEIIAASHTGELLEGAADSDDPIGDLTAVLVAGSATPAGAQVTITNASDGSFRYDPPGGYSGAGSFQFRICDDGVPVAPPQCSAETTVTFDITGPELHFVDDSAAPGGDGGLNDPFVSLADLPTGRGTGDRIYVFEGTYATAHTLNADEHLIGQGHSGSSAVHLGVVAVGNGVLDSTPAAGVAPTIANTITFGGNNGLLRGVAIDSGASTGVTAGAVSGITVLESSLEASTTAANFNGTDASAAGVVFTSTTSTGGVNGIVLNNITDTFDFGTGALSGHSGVSFLGTGTLGTTSYAGTISKTSSGNIVELNGVVAATDTGTVTLSGNLACSGCSGVDVVNRDAGAITFSGTTKTLNTGVNGAVHLDNNDTAQIHFTGGGLDIDTTSGVGFNATNGATEVTVQGAGNSVASTIGTALNVVNSTIGAPGLTFLSIAANGASSGIVLDTTGPNGGLTVTGAAAAGSGGTIQNISGRGASFVNAVKIGLNSMNFINTATTAGVPCGSAAIAGANTGCNAAIHLDGVATVAFDGLNITGSGQQGINGNNVSDFALDDSVLSGLGNGVDEDGLHFHNLSGTNSFNNTAVTGSGDDNVNIQNLSGVSNITVTGGSYSGGVLGSGLLIGARGTANTVISVSGATTIDNNFSGGIVADGFDFATLVVDVTGASITNNNEGMRVSANNGTSRFDINDNDFVGNDFLAVTLLKAAFSTTGTLEGAVRNNNPIAIANGRPTDAVFAFQAGGGAFTTEVSGNTISYAGTQRALLLQAGQDGNGTLSATVTGNAIDVQLDGAGNAVAGVLAQAALVGPGTTASLCADIGGAGALRNTFTHSLGGVMAAGDIRVRQRNDGTVRMPGYAGGALDTFAVSAFLNGRNTVVSSTTATVGSTGFGGGAACPSPVIP